MWETILLLTDLCRNSSLSWTLEYSEAENTYYAMAKGIGIGEYFEVKRISDPERALNLLADKIVQEKK